MACSLIALMLARASSALTNGWNALSLTAREKRGRDVMDAFWESEEAPREEAISSKATTSKRE